MGTRADRIALLSRRNAPSPARDQVSRIDLTIARICRAEWHVLSTRAAPAASDGGEPIAFAHQFSNGIPWGVTGETGTGKRPRCRFGINTRESIDARETERSTHGI